MKKILTILLLLSSSIVFGQITIQLIKKDGVLYVPCKVNGLALNFIFDTGASEVTISLTEAKFMLKNNYLNENEVFGATSGQLASGEITNATTILLKEIDIAGIKIYNVRASIINHSNAPLLLGQTAMAKLGSFQIDPVNGTLTISSKGFVDINTTSIDSTVVTIDSTLVVIDSLAEIKTTNNKYSSEINVYTQAIIQNPHNENAYYKRGIAKHNSDDYQGAIEDFTKAITINPMNVEGYKSRGNARECLDDTTGARADYTKAIELNPKDAEAYKGRGDAKFNLNNSGAISDYTKAIELNPNYAEAYERRGDIKNNLEDYTGAKADYTKALEINITANAYIGRAMAKYQLDDNYGAMEDYTKAIQLNPNQGEKGLAYNGRGSAKFGLKDYYGAIADYTKAIELYPILTSAYRGRGKAKWRLNDNNGAIEDFTKAIDLFPEGADYYYYRGLILIDNGQKETGCMDLSKAGELGYKEAYEAIKKYCQ